MVVRGGELVAADLLATAEANEARYGFYGASVYVEQTGVDVAVIAATRLGRARWLTLFTAGDLWDAGLELWDTGRAPHYDVVYQDRFSLVARMVGCPHRLVPNEQFTLDGGV